MYAYMHHDSGEGCRRPYRIACHFISCLYSFENIQKGGVFKLYRVIIGWDHFDLALVSGRQILECPLCLARLNPKTTCWNSLGWSLCGQLKRQSFVVYFRKQGFAIASNCNSTGWDMIFFGGKFQNILTLHSSYYASCIYLLFSWPHNTSRFKAWKPRIYSFCCILWLHVSLFYVQRATALVTENLPVSMPKCIIYIRHLFEVIGSFIMSDLSNNWKRSLLREKLLFARVHSSVFCFSIYLPLAFPAGIPGWAV
jgi:hypothetical protein